MISLVANAKIGLSAPWTGQDRCWIRGPGHGWACESKSGEAADSGPQRSEAQGLGQAYYEFREYNLIRSHVLEDRVLNSEFGMRNAERKTEDRKQMTEDNFNCPDLYLSWQNSKLSQNFDWLYDVTNYRGHFNVVISLQYLQVLGSGKTFAI